MDIFVNKIYEQDKVINGLSVGDMTVFKNMEQAFGLAKFKMILEEINKREFEPMYFFHHYCQFVIFFQYDPILRYTFKLMDFSGNIDIALDQYLTLQKIGWRPEDMNKIMQSFQATKTYQGELGVLKVVDLA